MYAFNEFLIEGKEGKNTHLEHLEDEVFNNGVTGARSAIFFLLSLKKMLSGHVHKHFNLTTKFDGAPAIFAGINPENGKFFVATKSLFNTQPKINYTEKDIDANHSGGLAEKLKIALFYLKKLGIEGVIQGDIMFTHGELKKQKIDGEDHITFTPNTITYAIPTNSQLAKHVAGAKIGVVWHTTYRGDTIQNMKAEFGVDISRHKHTSEVWSRNADYTDASGTASFTAEETAELDKILTRAGSLFTTIPSQVLNRFAVNETYRLWVKTYLNSLVRSGKSHDPITTYNGLVHWIDSKLTRDILDSKKADTKRKRTIIKRDAMAFFRGNSAHMVKIFELHQLLTEAKHMVVRKISMVKDIGTFLKTDDGFKVTAPEGFVAIDKLNGNAVKLVDRLTFSHANFNAAKNWDK